LSSSYRKTVLPDGLKIVSESIPAVRSISIGLWVDIGSRDEPEGLEGVSHFIEHMVFKGTTTRSSFDIVSYIESVGGILNAFTTRELTDMVFNARFDSEDIKKEKKIVVDEINEVKDTPADLVHDLFAQSIFGKHPLGKPILGSMKTVSGFSRKKVISFLSSNYLRHSDLVRLVKKQMPETVCCNNQKHSTVARTRRTRPQLQPGIFVTSRKTNQTHICIGMPALKFSHPKRASLLLLNSILGGGMSSKLFQKIREDMGLAYTVFSYLDFFKDTGVIGVYLNTEKSYTGAVLRAVFDELEKLKNTKLDSKELDSTKEQLKGSLVLGLENTSHRMNRLAKHELLLGEYISIDETISQIDSVSSASLRDVAAKLFQPDKLSVTVLGPVTKKAVENSINWRP